MLYDTQKLYLFITDKIQAKLLLILIEIIPFKSYY